MNDRPVRGSVFKRKGAKYFTIKFKDDTGRWVSKTTRCTNKALAGAELTKIVGLVNDREYRPPKNIRFSDLAAKWLAYKKAKTRSRTVESYQTQLDKRILPTFGPLWLRSITREMVREWEGDLLNCGLSMATCGHSITVLKGIFNLAVEDDYLVKSPAISLKKPKREKAKVDFLTADEIKALLAATDKKDYCMMLTACLTGCRRGEVLGLRWEDIDFRGGVIHVNQQLTNQGTLGPLKSAESKRPIPVPATLVNALKEHQARQAVELESNDLNLVFLSPDGKPWDGGNMLHRVFQPAIKRAGLSHRRFHDLRHSYCVLLLSEGTPIKAAQKLMGHHSISVTGDIYGDVVEGVIRTAADTLERSIFGASETPATPALVK